MLKGAQQEGMFSYILCIRSCPYSQATIIQRALYSAWWAGWNKELSTRVNYPPAFKGIEE